MNFRQIAKNETPLAIGKNEDNQPIYYVPRPHQMALHTMRGKAFMRALIMGYGGGKTLFGCAELIQIASMYGGARLLDVSPSYKQARRTTIETYNTMLDATGLPVAYNKTEHEYRFPNGSVIWIASGDNPDSLKGPNISHARIDEPFIQDRAVYDQVIARLRLQVGPLGLVLTGTPESLNWGYDLLYGDPQNGREISKAIIQASTLENTHLPASYIENLYASYDERMIAAYLEGQFVSLDTKQAYYQFDSTVHCQPLRYDPDKPLYFVMDFNVEPFCANVIQQAGDVDQIIDEIHILRNGTTERACDEFLGRYGKHTAGVYVTGDPAGTARNVQSKYGGYNNFSIVKEKIGHMPRFALKQPPGQVPMINSINLVNSRLKDAKGVVRVAVDPKCKYTIQDFERVMRDNENKIEKSDENITHHSDGIRYYLWTYRRGAAFGGAS